MARSHARASRSAPFRSLISTILALSGTIRFVRRRTPHHPGKRSDQTVQASLWIRSCGPGAIGPVPRYATSASTSNPGAVTRLVPPFRLVNPSPPLARKSFVATLYVAAGSTATPFNARPDTRCPNGFFVSYEYVKPADTCRIFVVVCPPNPANCCSSTSLSCAPVYDCVTTRLLNGCTAKHSPYVTSPGASPPVEF